LVTVAGHAEQALDTKGGELSFKRRAAVAALAIVAVVRMAGFALIGDGRDRQAHEVLAIRAEGLHALRGGASSEEVVPLLLGFLKEGLGLLCSKGVGDEHELDPVRLRERRA